MEILYKHENGFILNGRVYCEVYCQQTKETNDELLEKGWNPSMEENGIWYQSRSLRIPTDKFKISSKRRNILNKLTFKIYDYKNQLDIDKFFEKYYNSKNFEIYDLYENCSKFFNLKVLEISFNDSVIAYNRFLENQFSNLFVNLSYNDEFSKFSLGTNTFYILSEFTKNQNKKYLYIYESYDNLFSYKKKFENVEIWNGRNWITSNEK